MANLPNDPTDLVFYAIIRGTTIIGVQTNAYDVVLDSDPGLGTFTLAGFTVGGSSMINFLGIAQNPTGTATTNRQLKIYARYNGIVGTTPLTALRNAFQTNASMSGTLTDPGGTPVGGTLNIHFRCLSSIDYFSLPAGATAVVQIPEAANATATNNHGVITTSTGYTASIVAVTGGNQLQIGTGAPLGTDQTFTLSIPSTVNAQTHTSQFAGTPIALFGAATFPAAATTSAVQPNVAADTLKPVVSIKSTSTVEMPTQLTIPIGTTNATVGYSYYVDINDLIKTSVPGHIDVHAASLTFSFKLRHKHNGTSSTATATYAYAGAAFSLSALPAGATSSGLTASTTAAYASALQFSGTLNVDGSIESITLTVNVSDRAGNVATDAIARTTLIQVPTDVALVLDYSGSMDEVHASISKWAATVAASKLFNTIYGQLKPTSADTLTIVEFYNNGSNQTSSSGKQDPATTLTVPNDGSDPDAMNFTPIGAGLDRAFNDLKVTTGDNSWRNRVIFVMTDGIENRAPLLDNVRDTSNAAHVTGWADDARTGFSMHALAFGGPAQISTGELEQLVDGAGVSSDFHYDGTLFSSETADDPNDPDVLEQIFVNLLPSAIPVEQVPISGSSFTIEPGVDKVVFVKSAGTSFTVTRPGGATVASSAANGISYVTISSGVAAGSYGISGTTTNTYCLVDLALRTAFQASRDSAVVGAPITLSARIEQDGQPLSGAIVEVNVRRPGESVGQVITTLVQSPSASRIPLLLAGTKDPVTLQALQRAGGLPAGAASGTAAIHGVQQEPLALRRQLLLAAEAERGFPLRIAASGIRLYESSVTRGLYEAVFYDTIEEGTYSFHFTAKGTTSDQSPFARTRSISRHTANGVSGAKSGVVWTAVPLAGGKTVNWQAALTLINAGGNNIGPALANNLQVLAVVDKEPRPLPVVDPLNGTYAVSLTLPVGVSPPRLLVSYQGQAGGPVSINPGGSAAGARCRHVRVVLNKVQIKDAHEPWFKGAGELVFRCGVAPNGDRDRAQIRSVPPRGHLELRDGQTQTLREVLFDGHLLEGETLLVSIGGTELDGWFDADDKLMRYSRRFSGPISTWAGNYGPDDEPNDPESLRDWKLWYSIDVS